MTIPTPHANHGFTQTAGGYEQQQVESGSSGRPSMWWHYTVSGDTVTEILVTAQGSNGTRQHAAVPSVRPTLVVLTYGQGGAPPGAPSSIVERDLPSISVAGFNSSHEWGIRGPWADGCSVTVGVRGVSGDDAVPCCYTVTDLTFADGRLGLDSLAEPEETLRGV